MPTGCNPNSSLQELCRSCEQSAVGMGRAWQKRKGDVKNTIISMEIKQQITTAVRDELQALDLQVLPAMQ